MITDEVCLPTYILYLYDAKQYEIHLSVHEFNTVGGYLQFPLASVIISSLVIFAKVIFLVYTLALSNMTT